MPRTFFEQHVRPTYEEWLRHSLDERLAKSAAQEANNMAAYVLQYWQDLDRSQVYGFTAKEETRYRNALADRECSDFALARDVAEAHKHRELTREPRLITRYDQTAARETEWDEAEWDKAPWDGELIVTLDDGTSRPLAEIMKNVIEMWERLLHRMML